MLQYSILRWTYQLKTILRAIGCSIGVVEVGASGLLVLRHVYVHRSIQQRQVDVSLVRVDGHLMYVCYHEEDR